MHKTRILLIGVVGAVLSVAACTSTPKPVQEDFGFDGTCVNCHAGMSAGHTHGSFKLRCIDCHGGNDQVSTPADVLTAADPKHGGFRDPMLIAQAHVPLKDGKLARFFFANGVDDNNDGRVDETIQFSADGKTVTDVGEVFEPQIHGEGPGEFVDTELNRDLNYTRFLNPGDLRVASIGCGAKNRAGLDGGFGCHQQTIDVVRRGIMVNQSAVTNGAYYGNESWRDEFIQGRMASGGMDPRNGAFSYALDYDGADACIVAPANLADPRSQPKFDAKCAEARAVSQDPSVDTGKPGNAGLPPFEIAEGTIKPVNGSTVGQTLVQTGANDTLLPWGGHPDDPAAERSQLQALRDNNLPDNMAPDLPTSADPFPPAATTSIIPDPVDVTLRTFRAYYPLNYPGSTNNFDFTFGTSIQPEIGRFKTADPFGRGHSSGCSACHAPYAYDGSRLPTQVLQDDGKTVAVVDPTTQHREFHADQDSGQINNVNRLLGRAVNAAQQQADGREQQKTYSANHQMTTKIDTDTCGLCHGFVTRINYAYQGMAEEEQRDQLARRKEIDFTTAAGTKVRIFDSWVREDKNFTDANGSPIVPIAAAQKIIDNAKKRDAALAAFGFVAGNGGCAQNTFTEDCNNNGELDHSLTLTHTDENGAVTTATLDEDGTLTLPDKSTVQVGDGDGSLGLIDRLPREKSIDGRQMRYVYGGRNGSTRQMDIHFQVGMHCIDCHFLQDVHGDGHVYSTNWDNIEIECEDCHGASKRATLATSGPNGGNDLTLARDDDRVPFFQRQGNQIIQRSRVTPGLQWVVPQTVDVTNPLAAAAHTSDHIAEPGKGSTYGGNGQQGQAPLMAAKVECQTCHSSWVHNCMGCHLDTNLGDTQRKTLDAQGNITQSAHENETWLTNNNNAAHVNFQLLGLLRSPFVLGTGSLPEKGRLSTFRSSMEVLVTITDTDGNQFTDNQTFTTFQTLDANSQRMNVATSGVAMNQTMPHTTRPNEARSCAACHSLVDSQGRVRNEHWMAETFGLGSSKLPYLGDWAMTVGGNGLELVEHKAEKELAANISATGERFPGFIINPNNPTSGNVEPIFGAGVTANDIALVRNFNTAPGMPGGTFPPTLRDVALLAVDNNGAGQLVVTDITHRGHPREARQLVTDNKVTFVLPLPGVPLALAHLAPDVSDPFVYIAVGAQGITVVDLLDAPNPTTPAAKIVNTVALQAGHTATDVVLAGDMLYVGTLEGTIEAYSLTDPKLPAFKSSTTVDTHPINDLAVSGFVLYVATQSGVGALTLDDPNNPKPPSGLNAIAFSAPPNANGISVSAGHVYVAADTGVFDIDSRTVAAPAPPVNLGAAVAAEGVDLGPISAADVVVSKLPGQTWIIALQKNGDLVGLKLDNRLAIRERCPSDPRTPVFGPSCLLDDDYLDPTVSGRDPAFAPDLNQLLASGQPAGAFDATTDGPPGFRITHKLLSSGKKIARPAVWEQINTLTGRRLRDSFMPGSGTLSLGVMQVMRSVLLCESTTPGNTEDGLNALGQVGNGGPGATCQPLLDKRRPESVCQVQPNGVAQCKPHAWEKQPASQPASAQPAPASPSAPSPTTVQITPPFQAPSVLPSAAAALLVAQPGQQ